MIHIITDSTCDLSHEDLTALDVTALPQTVHFGEKSYRDGIDIASKEFFEKLEKATELPTTSQINPGEFIDAFTPYIDAGDEVMGIFLSSHLSGNYQSAMLAAQQMKSEKIHVIDSQNVTISLGLLVRLAAALRDQGLDAPHLLSEIKRLAPKIMLVAVVDTLKYLKMGGRISATTSLVGGLLGIHPIMSVYKTGKIAMVGKTRGTKAAYHFLKDFLNQFPMDERYSYVLAHANSPQMLENLASVIVPSIPCPSYYTAEIGSVVGTHVGPGAAGIAYVVK